MSRADSPPEGLRERKKRALRKQILETAGRLFAEHGYAETRIEEIAAPLNISAATIFNYFGSKDGLLLELAEASIARFETILSKLAEETDTTNLPAVDELSSILESAFREGPTVNRRLYVEFMRVTLPHEAGSRISDRIHVALARLIEQAQQRGELRQDLEAEALADLAADVMTGAFNNWLNDPRRPLSERLGYGVKFLLDATQARGS